MTGINFKKNKVCIWDNRKGFIYNSKPLYITGINYVPGYVCTDFWKKFRSKVIENDLKKIKKLGLNAVRIPVHWETSEPSPGKYSKKVFEEFDFFLKKAEENGIFVMPFFLVGTCTAFYDVKWRNKRSFFLEPMITYAENNIKEFVRRFKDRPNILCWDINDEPEFYSILPDSDPLPYKQELIENWVKRMYYSIKKIDRKRCVNLGFCHINNNKWGINTRNMAKILDCMTVTCYPPYAGEELYHSFRNTYFPGWNTRFCDMLGKGTFAAEAPGGSNTYAGKESMQKYFRVTLYSLLVNGSKGTLPWVWTDYDKKIHTEGVLNTYLHEPYFGITTSDGNLKPSGEELSKFAEFINRISIWEWKEIRDNIHVLVPENYYEQLPDLWLNFYNSFMFLRGAGLFVNYLWENEFEPYSKKVIFLPCSGGYTHKTWYKLLEFVKNGGLLYCSFTNKNQLNVVTGEIFGVEVIGQNLIHKPIYTKFIDRNFKNCLENSYPAGKIMLYVKPTTSKVIAETSSGYPFAVMNKINKGKTLFITYPWENSLPQDFGEKPEEIKLSNLYLKFTELSENQKEVICNQPAFETGIFKKNNRILLIIINHLDRNIHGNIKFKRRIKNIIKFEKDKKIESINSNSVNVVLSGCDVLKVILEF